MKTVSSLTCTDLRECRVWRFTANDTPSEIAVRPVKKIPVSSLAATLVGCEVLLSSGKRIMALLGNIDTKSARLNEHFVSLSAYREDGQVFHLDRYHDFDYEGRGPDALAVFLEMKVADVFPIAWDVRNVAVGDEAALYGKIEASPKERLSRAEVIALAVP